jgi:hypothetical protein
MCNSLSSESFWIWYDVTSIVPPKMKQQLWKHIYVLSSVLW